MSQNKNLAIIGMGPRGLHALENLLIAYKDKIERPPLKLFLFEPTGKFGNGHVYDTKQVDSNWINITERVLSINKREALSFNSIEIPEFPSYHHWANINLEKADGTLPDTYPPRSKIGKYLKARFLSIITPLKTANLVSLLVEKVIDIEYSTTSNFTVFTHKNSYKNIDNVLLTIGHQPTEWSAQIFNWEYHSSTNKNITLFKSPYPVQNILKGKNLNQNSSIGLRGFGLAMIDIVRAVAKNFGAFNITDKEIMSCTYKTLENSKLTFVPFSLDGLPPVPKPLNARIDELYQPTEEEIANFEQEIGRKENQIKAEDEGFVIDAMSPIIERVFLSLTKNSRTTLSNSHNLKSVINSWLMDSGFDHDLIVSRKLAPQEIMEVFVAMAVNSSSISLDYCIGQVWRHCQPSIYDKLSYNECDKSVFAKIIKLDERLKRYSYGPPVESIQQLLALIAHGILNLNFVADPEITLTQSGWNLSTKNKAITVDLMVNSVLDAPKIKDVNSRIVTNLLSSKMFKVAHDDFGVETNEYGYLTSEGENNLPIALLGRLAKGTIIGVDAILECFGDRSKAWASKTVELLNS